MDRLRQGRQALNRNGASTEPIWVTEFGWASGGQSSPFTVGESQQAANLDQTYGSLLANRGYYRLLGATWFAFKDHRRAAGQDPYWGFNTGLLRLDGSAEPAWAGSPGGRSTGVGRLF